MSAWNRAVKGLERCKKMREFSVIFLSISIRTLEWMDVKTLFPFHLNVPCAKYLCALSLCKQWQ